MQGLEVVVGFNRSLRRQLDTERLEPVAGRPGISSDSDQQGIEAHFNRSPRWSNTIVRPSSRHSAATALWLVNTRTPSLQAWSGQGRTRRRPRFQQPFRPLDDGHSVPRRANA